MASYYLLPDSAYARYYSGLLTRKPPVNVWIVVTFTASYNWEGQTRTDDRCCCPANVDENGKWHFYPNGSYEWHGLQPDQIRLWRLAKESEIPLG